MKRHLILLLLLTLSAIAISYGQNSSAPRYEPEKAVVTVNGNVITGEELNYELKRLEEQAMMKGEQQEVPLNYAYFEELRKQVIEMLIVRELLIKECEERSIAATEKQITEQFEVLKNQFPSEQKFQEYLEYSSISREKLRSEIRISLTIDMLAESLLEDRVFSNHENRERGKQQVLAPLIDELYQQAVIQYHE